MKSFAFALAPLAVLTLLAAPASAKVADLTDRGFVVRHLVKMPASPQETWALLVKPSVWWDGTHTWSQDAANLSIDARPGGCFCEVLPGGDAKAPVRGGVEHMRVIYVEKPRALRMSGALGPLQADAQVGTLTVQLKADETGGGTQMLVEYVVGGYSRTPFDKLAPMVDELIGEQFQRLAAKLGGTFSAAFPGPTAVPEAGTPAEPPAQIAPSPTDGGVLPLADQPKDADGKNVGR